MTLSAGDLDRRITFEVATRTPDAANSETVSWAPAFKRWAAKRESPGSEAPQGQMVIRSNDVTWTVRYDRETLSVAPESHRILHGNVIYEIVGIMETNNARHDGLTFLCATRPDGVGARGRFTESEGSV